MAKIGVKNEEKQLENAEKRTKKWKDTKKWTWNAPHGTTEIDFDAIFGEIAPVLRPGSGPLGSVSGTGRPASHPSSSNRAQPRSEKRLSPETRFDPSKKNGPEKINF